MRIRLVLLMVCLATVMSFGTSFAETRTSWGQLKFGGEAAVDAGQGVSLHVAETAVRLVRFHSPIALQGTVRVRSLDEVGYPGALGVVGESASGVVLAFVVGSDGEIEEAWSYQPVDGILRDLRAGSEVPAEDLPEEARGLFGTAGAERPTASVICRRVLSWARVGGKYALKFHKAALAAYLILELIESCAGQEAKPQDAGNSSESSSPMDSTGRGGNGP